MTQPQSQTYTTSWVQSITEVPQDYWDVLAEPLRTPFLEWEWLRLLEASGSVSAQVGWLPLHLLVKQGQRLVAAAPLYLKGHSEGEFVFDHMWAHVAREMDIRYFPKMVGMSPFTPVGGYRFLVGPDEDRDVLQPLMLEALDGLCRANGFSCVSLNFVDSGWRKAMESLGFHTWVHQGYLWENRGYGSFEEYLRVFKTGQRRNIRRERAALRRAGVKVRIVEGGDITRRDMERLYDLYVSTNEKFGEWSCKYLEPSFFPMLLEEYGHRLLLVKAHRDDDPDAVLGMAFLVRKGEHLYGRYWGCFEHVEFLHFELCYYSPVEWALENGIRWYDPGMGGDHKMRRGFEYVPNYSLHRFFDPRLDHVFKQNIPMVNAFERERMAEGNSKVPFAKRRRTKARILGDKYK